MSFSLCEVNTPPCCCFLNLAPSEFVNITETDTCKNGKEECTVARFEENVKPFILNTTNCKAISKVWGTPYVEDWIGRKITLKVKKISAFGEMTDAVRVSNERPTETIMCELCGKPITAIPGRTAQAVAAATKAKYGKTICIDCANKEAKK